MGGKRAAVLLVGFCGICVTIWLASSKAQKSFEASIDLAIEKLEATMIAHEIKSAEKNALQDAKLENYHEDIVEIKENQKSQHDDLQEIIKGVWMIQSERTR